MHRLLHVLLATVGLLPATGVAKGEGVGLWMEGQVSEVRAEGQTIRLIVTGRFWLQQHRGTEPSVVEVSNKPIPAVLTQGRPFYAMTESWGGGSIRKSGALLSILQAAAVSGKPVKLELADSRVNFGRGGTLAVESAIVRRATDHALR
jgi:hypothetical protein